MLIKVTKEHIDKSERGDLNNCCVAKAIESLTGKRCGVYPRRKNGYIYFDITSQNCIVVFLPELISNMLYNYDNGYKLEEFEFELPID